MSKLAKLRDAVDEEIYKLKNEESSVQKLNAIHGALGKIIGSLNTELAYAKARGEVPNIEYLSENDKTEE